MQDLTVGDHLDQYLITDVLAKTAMATTFKGHDTEVGAPVCLKVPYLEYESDIVFHERFNREEQIGLRVEHRNIVRALKPRRKSRMYLVTEYVAGTSLRSLIEAGGLTAERAIDIACQLCEALIDLHTHGIVHRDLKPENVLVAADGTVKVIDFGIALDRTARRLTWAKLSATLGTPDYMAPEQVGGRRGDERCDIYAVGMILYEMLTNRLPFSGSNPFARMRAKTCDEPKPPTYFLPQLDPALSEIIDRSIARDARDRYPSAAGFLERLQQPHAGGSADDGTSSASARSRSRAVPRLFAALALATLGCLIWFSHRADSRTPPVTGAFTSQGGAEETRQASPVGADSEPLGVAAF